MNNKELGQTGEMIPEIGLGTWKYSSGIEPLRRGIELGAYLLDSAEFYGNERLVGEAIRGVRDRVILATKASPEHFKYSDLLQAADRSLHELGVDHIDLYQELPFVHFPPVNRRAVHKQAPSNGAHAIRHPLPGRPSPRTGPLLRLLYLTGHGITVPVLPSLNQWAMQNQAPSNGANPAPRANDIRRPFISLLTKTLNKKALFLGGPFKFKTVRRRPVAAAKMLRSPEFYCSGNPT